MFDLLTAATNSVLNLLDPKKPTGTELVGWPTRVDDIEILPWVVVSADFAGLDERETGAGDRRMVLVSVQCRNHESATGESLFWVEDALGRSLELDEKLTDDFIKVWEASFDPVSLRDDGADFWERTYQFLISCALICLPETQ